MRHMHWKKITLALLGGSILFQLPGCTETAIYISALAQTVTAGGVIYLIRKVLA